MTAKLMTNAAVSDVALARFVVVMLNEPLAIAETNTTVNPEVVPMLRLVNTTVSPTATVEFVTVNVAELAPPIGLAFVVIVPVSVLSVTPVDRLVACVTAPPAPVA